MKQLPYLVKNVIFPDEKKHFELNIQNYHNDAIIEERQISVRLLTVPTVKLTEARP
jgi:hypothetical protein